MDSSQWPTSVMATVRLSASTLRKYTSLLLTLYSDPKDVTDEEYKNFFKATFKQYTDPVVWHHFKGDSGPVSFKGLIYIPETLWVPFFLFIMLRISLFISVPTITGNLHKLLPRTLVYSSNAYLSPAISENTSCPSGLAGSKLSLTPTTSPWTSPVRPSNPRGSSSRSRTLSCPSSFRWVDIHGQRMKISPSLS